MKSMTYILYIILFFFLSCDEYSTTPVSEDDSNNPDGLMKITMDMTNAPSDVDRLEGKLYNDDRDEIYIDFEIDENSATALIEDIPSGYWILRVDAFDEDDNLIYTGTTEITVFPGVVTPVSLHLNPATGSLQITVKWGDDIIYIPDKNLLKALIEEGVDTNRDGLISRIEAEKTTELHMQFRGISDLTGIESFINLEILDCSYNLYPSIDVSKMQNLIYLDCSESKLTSLDVSHNPELVHLDCSDYQIPNLDVFNNPDLVYLNCHNNLLTTLDLTINTKLEVLWCQENQLTLLDLSNNTSLKEISLHSIPTLSEVCVWTIPFPPYGVSVDTYGSPNIIFTTDCSN